MRRTASLALLALCAPLAAAPVPAPYGILLLAHGGDSSWNAEVARLRRRVDAKVPTESALGMADPAALQSAVLRLEKRGVTRIVAVPLFVQSRSEVLDQTRYALGLSDKPSEALRDGLERMAKAHAAAAKARGAHGAHAAHGSPAHGHSMEFSTARVKSRGPIALADALDDHALVGRILVERAKALSRDAAKETVVLVAHGPVDEAAVDAWRASLASLCRSFAGFRGCAHALLRDDAAPEIRAAAVADLRALVSRAKAEDGRAVVIPVLIARGGIEKKIVKDLDGLDYAWDGRTLMPHDGFDAWVLERAASVEWSGRP
ncbi:MAG: hypothetical protein NDJ72_08195 [Elusimicrobia bacterium]|nr:hypothetical protein [Elusimicrobiota bacterium]